MNAGTATTQYAPNTDALALANLATPCAGLAASLATSYALPCGVLCLPLNLRLRSYRHRTEQAYLELPPA